MIKNYIIGGLLLVLIIVIFLGNNYYQDELKSREKALTQQYEKSITKLRTQLSRTQLERNSLLFDLNTYMDDVRAAKKLDSIQGTKKPRTYQELHNVELQQKMIEIFKEKN